MINSKNSEACGKKDTVESKIINFRGFLSSPHRQIYILNKKHILIELVFLVKLKTNASTNLHPYE